MHLGFNFLKIMNAALLCEKHVTHFITIETDLILLEFSCEVLIFYFLPFSL